MPSIGKLQSIEFSSDVYIVGCCYIYSISWKLLLKNDSVKDCHYIHPLPCVCSASFLLLALCATVLSIVIEHSISAISSCPHVIWTRSSSIHINEYAFLHYSYASAPFLIACSCHSASKLAASPTATGKSKKDYKVPIF